MEKDLNRAIFLIRKGWSLKYSAKECGVKVKEVIDEIRRRGVDQTKISEDKHG